MHKFKNHLHFKSLNACWKEGIASNVAVVLLGYYLLPFALFLGATPFQVGLLVALPTMVGALSQLTAERLLRWRKSRLNLLMQMTFLHTLFIISMTLLFFTPTSLKIPLLIAIAVFCSIFASLVGTYWGSLTSEYVADEERGSYFGWRSRIVGFWGLVTFGAGGFFLSWSKNKHQEVFGFIVLILFMSAAKFLSLRYYRQMKDLPFKPSDPQAKFTWKNFLDQFDEGYFIAFTIFMMAMTFSTQLAAPYFSVYMLEYLKFSYTEYMFVHLAGALAGIVSFPVWGAFADRIGNVRVIKITSLLIPIIPILWIASKNVVSLMVAETIGGFIWAGFNLATIHYIYDSTRPEKRVQFLSYFTLLNGACLAIAVSIGGFLAEKMPAFLGSKICAVFLISFFLRVLTHFLFTPHFKEVRKKTEDISWQNLVLQSVQSTWDTGRNQFFRVVTRVRKKSN